MLDFKYAENTDEIHVSVCCITYNHGDFISECLDSLVGQETDFPYEIVIHDDCSTDQTRQILLEYKTLYPDLIRLIFADENQFSKNPSLPWQACWSEAKGRYIALCEGDDLWLSSNKLREQYKILEENKNINLCFTSFCSGNHPSTSNYDERLTSKGIINPVNVGTIFDLDGGGITTASTMYRRSALALIPHWVFADAKIQDFYMQLYCAAGGAWYLSDFYVFYRKHQQSWSVSMDTEYSKKLEWYNNSIKYLKQIYRDFNGAISSKQVLKRRMKYLRMLVIIGILTENTKLIKRLRRHRLVNLRLWFLVNFPFLYLRIKNMR